MNIKYRYVEEMTKSGYSPCDIDDFHQFCITYLARRFFPNKDAQILDIGVGSGHCLLPLKGANYKNLIGLDIDTYNFPILESKGIRCIKGDIEKEPINLSDSSIDTVLSFHLIEHLVDSSFFLNEIFRVLKRDGILILVTPNWRRQYKIFWRDHTHVHPYDKESIMRLLRSHQFVPIWLRNFGVMRGLGRICIWKVLKSLMFTGIDLIVVVRKPK